ncbi:hypothetical protein B0J12DRAFT_692389 [Macrophomina phaseolina]|uniref:BZIP domain-containing protein n=1 Tax=Macrophomina phaseolina TaxID=35725 RepID=A0ABQ8FPG4_9PEZI|nr:hypothetical protein B0J12DRAFT_692389 [Macrophomina phaseolina]
MKNKSASDRQSRKRELDRKAQRLARERTKSRMAHLETLVAHFQETDSDVRSSSLIDRLSEAINEQDRLRSLLESLNFSIRSHLEETPVNKALPSSSTARKDNSTQPPQSGPSVPDSQETNQLASCRLLTETLGGTVSLDGNDGDIASDSSGSLQANPLLFELSPLPGSFISTDGATVPQAVLPECECMPGTLESTAITLSIWRELNELLKSLPEADLAAEDQESEDVIIRAVLDGWSSIGETGQVSTTCRKLRRLDELAWVQSNPTDRLAILSLMRLMVVSQNSTRQTELPRWLQARPSQKLPHAIAIDFVFWPGVRERLVFSEHEYCANSFWRCAFSSTRLAWPFDLRDAYVRNLVTGKLHLSPYFRMCIRDLSNWAMSPEFLNQYPELRDDIEGYSAPSLV